MYRVLVVMTLEYELRKLRKLPVWEEKSGFMLSGTACDGQQALKMLQKERYDLVIMEVNLPILDGLQLQRYIHEENLCPVVVVLGSEMEFQCVRECIMYGAFDYLQKMPDADTLLEMFGRAQEHLILCGKSGEGKQKEHYADIEEFKEDEDAVVEGILHHNGKAVQVFRATVNMIYQVNESYSVKGDIQVRQFFRSIVNRVFERMKWLHLYTDAKSYYRPDTLFIDHQIHSEDSYAIKLGRLEELVADLCPYIGDNVVWQIVCHVLEHPEQDLQLKALASEMFVNYSYLSNSFSALTGINYSEYVTKIRMKRAAFLLTHTSLRIGEISTQLTYRDNDYFARQFKRQYCMTPKAFRKANEPCVDYSFL